MRISIDEDHSASARSLGKTPEPMEHELAMTVDGAEAWESDQAAPSPLRTSDWAMPRLNGLGLRRTSSGRCPARSGAAREQDVAARHGGEEFVVPLPSTSADLTHQRHAAPSGVPARESEGS